MAGTTCLIIVAFHTDKSRGERPGAKAFSLTRAAPPAAGGKTKRRLKTAWLSV
jgi:hypothetical protein